VTWDSGCTDEILWGCCYGVGYHGVGYHGYPGTASSVAAPDSLVVWGSDDLVKVSCCRQRSVVAGGNRVVAAGSSQVVAVVVGMRVVVVVDKKVAGVGVDNVV